MTEMKWHLAQINIAKTIGININDPIMAKFVAQLDEINALAEGSPGFVWRLKDESDNATSINPYNDERIIINMSVWESLDHLKQFAYYGRHAEVLRQKRDWFVNFGRPYTTLWYVPVGVHPTVEDAVDRLKSLEENGPTPYAFDFKTKFAAPSSPLENIA
jgi:Domain of unknown function (DUF3291)